MKIYLTVTVGYDEYWIRGVFATEAEAQRLATWINGPVERDLCRGRTEVREFEVQDTAEVPWPCNMGRRKSTMGLGS